MATTRGIARSGQVLGLAIGLLGSQATAETLPDALLAASQTNPGLQARREGQRAVDELEVQARAGYQPTLGVTGVVLRTETSLPLLGQLSASGVALVGQQPLYTGGRVGGAVAAARADVAAGRESLRVADQTLLLDVIVAYSDVRRDRQRLAVSRESADVLRRQLQEARANLRVMVITKTDLAQTEARLAIAETRVADDEAQLGVSEDTFRALVGHSPHDLAPEPPIASALPASLEAAQGLAAQRDPRIRQAEATARASAARVEEARAQSRPQVSLRASVGMAGGAAGNSPFRDYDRFGTAAVVVSLPLASGGVIASGVRQAAARASAADLAARDMRRQSERLVAHAWRDALAARAAVAGTTEQVRAAAAAWEGVRRETEVGLRTPLDVLNAEQALREAQFALISAHRDEYVASAAILAAMGALELDVFSPGAPSAALAPTASPRAVPWTAVVEALDGLGAPVAARDRR